MSDLLDRTRARLAPDRDEPSRPTPTAALAAVGTGAAGMALCVAVAMVGWLAGSSGTPADAVRAGLQVWLVGHGAGLHVGSATVTAVPLGIGLLLALGVWWSSVRVAAISGLVDARGVVTAAAVFTAVYSMGATTAALLTADGAVSVEPVRAFVSAAVVGATFSLLGAARGAGVLEEAWLRLPATVRAALRGAAAGALALVVVGLVLVTGALAADFGAAANIAREMSAGVVGGAVFTLAGVLLLPNAALLAVAYTLGPGFAFGAGTVVSPTGVGLGRVPTFPLLAALPSDGVAPPWATGLLVAPVVAGLLAGVVAERCAPPERLDAAALLGGAAGLAGGVTVGLATVLGGGSAGPGRLAEVGADWPACTAVAAVTFALAGAVGAMLSRLRAQRREP